MTQHRGDAYTLQAAVVECLVQIVCVHKKVTVEV